MHGHLDVEMYGNHWQWQISFPIPPLAKEFGWYMMWSNRTVGLYSNDDIHTVHVNFVYMFRSTYK